MNRPTTSAMMAAAQGKPAPVAPPIPPGPTQPKPPVPLPGGQAYVIPGTSVRLPPRALAAATEVEKMEPLPVPARPLEAPAPGVQAQQESPEFRDDVGVAPDMADAAAPEQRAVRIVRELMIYVNVQPDSQRTYILDQIIERGLVAEVSGKLFITPKGMGILLDLGVM